MLKGEKNWIVNSKQVEQIRMDLIRITQYSLSLIYQNKTKIFLRILCQKYSDVQNIDEDIVYQLYLQ